MTVHGSLRITGHKKQQLTETLSPICHPEERSTRRRISEWQDACHPFTPFRAGSEESFRRFGCHPEERSMRRRIYETLRCVREQAQSDRSRICRLDIPDALNIYNRCHPEEYPKLRRISCLDKARPFASLRACPEQREGMTFPRILVTILGSQNRNGIYSLVRCLYAANLG